MTKIKSKYLPKITQSLSFQNFMIIKCFYLREKMWKPLLLFLQFFVGM